MIFGFGLENKDLLFSFFFFLLTIDRDTQLLLVRGCYEHVRDQPTHDAKLLRRSMETKR